jgi:5-methylcytosine-specific restriction endonuclease McrA
MANPYWTAEYKRNRTKFRDEYGPHYCYFPECPKKHEPIDLSLRGGTKWAFTVQHIVPRSQGGGDNIENFAAAHHSCNSKEGNRMAGNTGNVNTAPVVARGIIQSRVW